MAEEDRDIPEPIFNCSSLQEFTQTVLKKVVTATQNGNSLCSLLEEFEYWSSFPEFHESCVRNGTKILDDIGELLRHHAVQCGWVSTTSKVLSSVDIEERFERLVDSNDIILENVGSLIDEASGIKKNDKPLVPINVNQTSPIVSSWNRRQNQFGGNQSGFKLLLAKNIQRPQLKWMEKVDNRNTPFLPYLKEKPNAMKSVSSDEFYESMETDPVENLIHQARIGNDEYRTIKHPYENEISEFEPSMEQLERKDVQMYWAIDEKDVNMVETEEELSEMFEHLKTATEIAIDLEHHSYRSFQGFVCLMQISTRTEDFIVDTLKLRDELYILNKVFTDPKILKVLHGANMDIGWLMRDFGLYIVNMFDTGQAARTLNEERFSLAYLLKKHCDVNAQKQYQLADWRIRPLPKEMVSYGREDTHYLLYVYDSMRNQLIDRGNEMNNLLRSVYSKSARICQTLYEKPRFYPDSYFMAYQKYRGRLNQQQLECFRLLYEWRDVTSRDEDESYGYTLPNHMLFRIAENLPREAQGIIACCNPVPPLVKQNLMDIHRLVLIAREFDPVQASSTDTVMNESYDAKKMANGQDDESSTYYDDSKSGFELYSVTGPAINRRVPSLTVFEEMEHLEITEGKKKARELLSMLSSPFQQYLPNTGLPEKHPDKINESWKDSSKQALSKEKEVIEIMDDQILVTSETNEVNSNTKQKRKHIVSNEEEKTLRDLLPSKKKKKKQKDLKQKTDNDVEEYVPFDYSKTDPNQFSENNETSSSQKMDLTQEPDKGKTINTKVRNKAGTRSMTFQ